MKLNLKIIDWSLRHKIILHLFAVGAVASMVWIFLYLSAQNNLVNIFNHQLTELAGSLIRCNLTYIMNQNTPVDIKPALKRMSELTNISKVRILDENGRIQHSSQGSETGKFISAEELVEFRRYDWQDDSQVRFSRGDPDDSTAFMAIRNEASCYSCHDPSREINGILELKLKDTKISPLLERNRIKVMAVGLIALIVLIFVILRLFEKIINRPLSRLKSEMKKVRKGDLDVAAKPRNDDEIGELTRSFNLMVGDLKEARHKIKQLHEQEMEKAGHLASVGELAAGLAHEIKNPIAGINSSLEIICQKTPEGVPEKEIFREILKQTDRIHMIIQDLLSYAKPKPLSREQVNINQVIQRALKLAESQTKDKDIALNFNPLPGESVFMLDENKIQEVILNLLLNSIAAIEDTGVISITLSRKKEKLLISIADNGRGIQQEHADKVFSPFFTTRRKGTGLGLSICKKIVEEHEGDIKVKSRFGKGTEFIISLPVESAPSNKEV